MALHTAVKIPWVGSDPARADGKGVRCRVEWEGSLRQGRGLGNMNLIEGSEGERLHRKSNPRELSGSESANVADKWNEGGASYPGSPHGRVETE
jgi:hypothetical protein